MKPYQIKKIRQKIHLTQESFADAVGVSFATVNRWENGKASPQKDRVARMKALEVSGYDFETEAPRYHESTTTHGRYDAPVCGYLAKVDIPQSQCEEYKYPFNEGETVLVLGDIAMMPGHCVIADRKGRVHFGYHTSDFRKLTQEEV